MKRFLCFLALALLCALPARAQVSVSLAPSIHQQFVDGTGKPLAGGFLYFYAAGTTTLQNTYADPLGTIANPNPIPLDATGAPSNGSTQVQVRLLNQSYNVCAYSSALVQQFCWDNVSAYQILNNIQNVTFGSVTSDPTGAAGALGYRSDIPCFRGFTAFWDCFVTFTGIQTLTNKTLTSPVINTPTINSPTFTGTWNFSVPSQSITVANAVAGTTLNALAKLTGAPSTAVVPSIADVGGVMGVVTAGAGTTGSATIQTNGITPAGQGCIFDGATVAGDYVQISATVAGDCHDVGGGGYPSSGQVIGRVLSSNGGGGTYSLEVFPPDIRVPGVGTFLPSVVYNAPSASTNTSIGATTMVTVGASNATYQFTFYASLTVVGASCSASATFAPVNILWQDPLAAAPGTDQLPNIVTTTGIPNGVLGSTAQFTPSFSNPNTLTIRAKAGTVIQYSTTYTLGASCSPGPSYQIFPVLEQLTAN